MGALDNATTLLTTASNALREVYHPTFWEAYNRFGSVLNKLFKPSKRKINGDGITIQIESKKAYPGRFGRSINGGFPKPRGFGVGKYKVLLSETDASNNFSRLSGSAAVTDLDLQRALDSKAAAVNFIERTIQGVMKHMAETMAVHRHCDATARVCTVNGTVKKNDQNQYANCAAIGATGGIRFVVANGSISALPPGLVCDIYSSAGVLRCSVELTDYNPRDKSVGAFGLNANGDADSTVDLSGVGLASTDEVFISGERNLGLISIGEWFKTPAATGDSFFGLDRMAPQNRYMQVYKTGPSAARPLAKGDLDNASIELGYQVADPETSGFVVMTTPEIEQTYRNLIGADIFIPFPTTDQKGELIASYGFDGNLYRHPLLGRVSLQSDPLAPPNKIRWFKPGDFEQLSALNDNWRWLEGDVGYWYRIDSDTPNEGRGTVWRADGYGLFCDICTAPREQLEIENVTA